MEEEENPPSEPEEPSSQQEEDTQTPKESEPSHEEETKSDQESVSGYACHIVIILPCSNRTMFRKKKKRANERHPCHLHQTMKPLQARKSQKHQSSHARNVNQKKNTR